MQYLNIHFCFGLAVCLLVAVFGFSAGFGATAIPPSAAFQNVSTSNPGFRVRVVQADSPTALPNTIDRAEQQLAGTLVDPVTKLPFANVADLSAADSDGYFMATGVINYSTSAGAFAGNFTPDEQMPGLPGQTSDPDQNVANVAAEILAYLDLKAGAYRFGVNAADGFSVSTRDIFAPPLILGQSEMAGETNFDFSVSRDGFYPFRIVYVHGAGEGSIELFSIDPDTDEKILLNDPTDDRSVKAYQQEAVASVVSLTPGINAEAVSANTSISAVIAHSPSNLDTNTIRLALDGLPVTPAIVSGSDTNYLQVAYQPVTALTDGNHAATLIFGASADGLVTNQWSFNVGLPKEINLSITPSTNGLTISWTGGGTLQAAPTILGSWTNLSEVSSVTVQPIGSVGFFRVRRP